MNQLKSIFIILATSGVLIACQPQQSEQTQNSAPQPTVETDIKAFSATQEDATDIERLNTFNTNFISMSNEMYHELEQLKAQNTLQPDFVQRRKRDQALSALNMLKDLELSTPQGHYIQGMLYDYWEQQLKFLDGQQQQAPNKNIVLQAEHQLQHWQAQTKKA